MPRHRVLSGIVRSIGLGALVAAAHAQRAQSFSRLHPDLRWPQYFLRHPKIPAAAIALARLAPSSTPVDGVTVEKRSIPGPAGELTIYVYRPREFAVESKQKRPAMLYSHGGGFVFGSAPYYHEPVSRYAAEIGCLAVSTEYRLAPQHRYPAALDDVHAAYRWLVEQAETLGIDPARITVAGDSAGGGLTAALCQRLLDEGGQRPRFQALIYPMLDDRTTLRQPTHDRGEFVWRPASNLMAWSSYLGRRPSLAPVGTYAAPARRDDLSGLPATWIGVGELDLFYDEDTNYASRLSEAGVDCEVNIVDGAFHGFDLLHEVPLVQEFRQYLVSAVKAQLNPSPVDLRTEN